MKNLLIVADKSLRKQAIGFTHSLSKIEDIKAVYWTPRHLLDNEATLTGVHPIIFIGRNDIVNPYIDVIEVMSEKHGVHWGYDGSKAAIYVESSPGFKILFLKDVYPLINKEYREGQEEIKESIKSKKNEVSDSKYTLMQVGKFLFDYLGPIFDGKKYEEYSREEILMIQYTFGIHSFLQHGLEDYIEQLP